MTFPRLLGGLSLLVLAAIAIYFLFLRSDDRAALLAGLDAALAETDGYETTVTLEQCTLQVDRRGLDPASQNLSIARLRANLGDYHTASLNLRPLNDGRMVLSLQRKSLSPATIDTAQQILRLVPATLGAADPGTLTLVPNDGPATQLSPLPQPAQNMTRADLEAILSQPNGTLTFRLGVLLPENPDEIEPHKDAPAFHQLAHAVLGDDTLRAYSVQLVYLGAEAEAERLLVGGVVTPPDVQFVLPSEEKAKELANLLLRYSHKNCQHQ